MTFFIGIILVGGISILFLNAYEIIHLRNKTTPEVAILSSTLGLPLGIFFIWRGYSQIRMREELEQKKKTSLNKPWEWDFPWDPHGIKDDNLKVFLIGFGGSLLEY